MTKSDLIDALSSFDFDVFTLRPREITEIKKISDLTGMVEIRLRNNYDVDDADIEKLKSFAKKFASIAEDIVRLNEVLNEA